MRRARLKPVDIPVQKKAARGKLPGRRGCSSNMIRKGYLNPPARRAKISSGARTPPCAAASIDEHDGVTQTDYIAYMLARGTR
jgi:hypothetical protein